MSDSADVRRRWRSVGCRSDFVEDVPVGRTIEGVEIALFRVGDSVFALADRCTHGNARLSEGYLEKCGVECPLHQSVFDLATGVPRNGPAQAPVRTFPVRISAEKDEVLVEI
jgi:anthranilate 1,2-dioxygenase ferredoxin component